MNIKKQSICIIAVFLFFCIISSTSAICQYANNAEATDQAPNYEAIYSTGPPGGDRECSTPPALFTSWMATQQDGSQELTLTFPNQIYPTNLTIFGDYELCIDRAWLWRNNSWYLFMNDLTQVTTPGCIREYNINYMKFKTDRIKLETCSWAWSAIDSVRFCGSIHSFPQITINMPIQDMIINNSENSTTIRIRTDVVSQCEFSYNKDFKFNEGIDLSTTDGITHSYNFVKPSQLNSIELFYKCMEANGEVNPYSIAHRFYFKDINSAFVDLCEWHNCRQGAASISIDEDFYHSITPIQATCKDELEARGLRGTYFLPYTNLYDWEHWQLMREIYSNAHEIAGHSQAHNCSYDQNQAYFINDIQNNINDIIGNIGMKKDELITFAWPCGAYTSQYESWLSDYYLFSRGYHFNLVESKNPDNFMNIKSINSIGIGDIPPDYYLLADVTESYQGWANYVYHYSCDNPEIMDYLLNKDTWIERIGTISKYIKERQNVKIQNINNTPTGAKFDLVNPLNTTIYNQELTLKIYLGNGNVNSIRVNGINTPFTKFTRGNQPYLKFNVLPTGTNAIEILGLGFGSIYCGDGNINQVTEECDDGNNIDGDGCSSNCKIQELPPQLCQYANHAEATEELSGYKAAYSIGIPNGDGLCNTAPYPSTAWMKTDWNLFSNITLIFLNPIYPANLTIFGDYDLCINRAWLWNNNSWYLFVKGGIELQDEACIERYNISLDIKTNRIKIETCNWAWSAIDAVKLCGSVESFPHIAIISPFQNRIIDSSINTTSVQISTDVKSQCELSYDKNFKFNEGIGLSTTDGLIHSYDFTKPVSMDSIEIYYKCKGENGKINSYSIAHRFYFKEIGSAFLEICNWYDCLEGAVSFSIDDGFHYSSNSVYATCKEELEKRNLKGTYFLAYTNLYRESDWQIWRDVYNNAHEVTGHSRRHNCSYTQDRISFVNDKQENINDIIGNVGIPREELISFAWPCGVALPQYKEWLSDYYLFARGYHTNLIESKNPEDFMDYKAINSIGFGAPPPDYYLLADVTENYQEWVNYVYHDSCDNPEIMDYLSTKDLWVKPLGTISKYIMERQDVGIKNINNTPTGAKFDLVNPLNTTIFNQELTLKIYLGNGNVNNIKVNGINTPFKAFTKGNQAYVKFGVLPLANNKIEIEGLDINIPYCGDNNTNQGSEECDDGNNQNEDGCSSNCKLETTNEIYVTLYVGNIDGSASPAWYHFYDRLTKYYENNQIPVGFSFFPVTINSNNQAFSEIFKRMYSADNIELFQKGFTMNETEAQMDKLSFEEQKGIIKAGQYYYINQMTKILNTSTIDIPVAYVAPFSRFTTVTRRALEELGFKTNFGLYYISELGPVEGTATLDNIQYGVSFTVSGGAGRDTIFKPPEQIIQELLSYYRGDVSILRINGKRVIPLFVHQPDFEDPVINAQIDETKWQIYNETITMLRNNPNITLLTPTQVWNLRHPACIPTNIPETFCNRIDDDCDGIIDEDFFVTPTTTCGVGACQSIGALQCIGYEIDICQPGIPSANDSACDGIDNDCDGAIDEECLNSIMLNKGWNLISIPVEPANKTVKSIFKGINYTSLLTYANNKWHELNESSLINETRGYWINSSKNQSLLIEGNEINNPNISLNNGWNLIGYPYLEQKEISALFNNVTVFAYNKSKWYSYDLNKPYYLNTLTKFRPGYGYWVSAS